MLQIDLVYRFASNRTGVIDRAPAAVETEPTMITHSGRTQGSRSIRISEVPTGSYPTGRLLNAQAVEDDMNPVVAVGRDIRTRWRCFKANCASQGNAEPAYYVKDGIHHLITFRTCTAGQQLFRRIVSVDFTVELPPMNTIVT